MLNCQIERLPGVIQKLNEIVNTNHLFNHHVITIYLLLFCIVYRLVRNISLLYIFIVYIGMKHFSQPDAMFAMHSLSQVLEHIRIPSERMLGGLKNFIVGHKNSAIGTGWY